MPRKKRRGSSLDRFFACPSSTMKPRAPHDPESEVAAFGTYVHAWIAALLEKSEEPPAPPGIDVDEAAELVKWAMRSHKEDAPNWDDWVIEIQTSSERITGTIDVLYTQATGPRAKIKDWKTGRKTSTPYREQLTGYGDGIFTQYPEKTEIECEIVWLRTGERETWTITRDDAASWRERYDALAKEEGKRFAAGEHCAYCKRVLECETLREYRRSAVAGLAKIAAGELTREKIAEVYDLAESTRNALKIWDDYVKLTLQTGEIELSGGRVLCLTQSSRATVDAMRAWPVLKKAGFTDSEINGALSVSLPALKKAAVTHGLGETVKAAGCEIEQRLDDAGALSRFYYDRKTVKKGKQQ